MYVCVLFVYVVVETFLLTLQILIKILLSGVLVCLTRRLVRVSFQLLVQRNIQQVMGPVPFATALLNKNFFSELFNL